MTAEMTEFRGQVEGALGAMGVRIEELARAVADARVQHGETHNRVGVNTENITQVAKDVAVLKRTELRAWRLLHIPAPAGAASRSASGWTVWLR